MPDTVRSDSFLKRKQHLQEEELQTSLRSHSGCTASPGSRTKNLSQIIDIYLIETAGCSPSPWEETIWKNSASRDNVCLLRCQCV